jgi:hypothetical protein
MARSKYRRLAAALQGAYLRVKEQQRVDDDASWYGAPPVGYVAGGGGEGYEVGLMRKGDVFREASYLIATVEAREE